MKYKFQSGLIPQFIAFSVCMLLTCCSSTAPHRQESTYPNVVRNPVPAGWRVGSDSHNASMRVVEFVPPDQTVDSWTELITVIVVYQRSPADLADYLTSTREYLPQECVVPSILSKPVHLKDHGYDAVTQTAACAESKRYGKGEVFMQKVMMGENAIFDVQRAWRFPRTQRSEDLPLSDAQRADGAAYLESVWVCNVTVESPGCPVHPDVL